jgi:DNA modification methylase
MIKNRDALLFLKDQADYSADLIYQDPPYALGSEIIIKPDGKVDYSKASDFMSKWEMPDGKFWEQYFKEAFRTLKYGGHMLMFGLDRQLLLFKYYSALAGFTEKQSLYWFFISNFPKASDLANMIAKRDGAKRDGAKRDGAGSVGNTFSIENEYQEYTLTPLAKKYSGYKYSIAPLKQTNETIMVFQKPYKTGSCLHDTLLMEKGNKKITC